MPRASMAGAILFLAFAPGVASGHSIAICQTYDASGLAAPWSNRLASQIDGETRWSVESGRLQRLSTRGGRRRSSATSACPPSRFRRPGWDGWWVRAAPPSTRATGTPLGTPGGRTSREPASRQLRRRGRLRGRGRRRHAPADRRRRPRLDAPPVPRTHRRDRPLFLDAQDGWMVSQSGAFLETHDSGATWESRPLGSAPGEPTALELVRFANPWLG